MPQRLQKIASWSWDDSPQAEQTRERPAADARGELKQAKGQQEQQQSRTGFFEIDGAANVYYVPRYPFRHKVLLVAAWDREDDPKAEFVVCL